MIRPTLLGAAVLTTVLLPDLSAQFQPVVAKEGRVAIQFAGLDALGLELVDLEPTAGTGTSFEESMEGSLVAFALAPDAQLKVLRDPDEGTFVPYGALAGSASVEGGFTLRSPSTGRAVDFHGFSMHTADVRNDGPGGEQDPDYYYISSTPDSRDFVLCYVKVFFSADETYGNGGSGHHGVDKLRIKAWDMIITPELADRLARPDLTGHVLGYGKFDATYEDYHGEWEHPQGQNIFTPGQGDAQESAFAGSFLDVKLGILSSITQMNNAHVGTFPNGRAGLSMSTTSCNVGDVNVTWLAAMNEDHPGIAMQLYRELDGRFEMVGTSWIKHGFFALSNSQCTPCQNPSPGNFLGVGCSDTYGITNNADRFWLGPRDEWNPHLGTWDCTGSYFDGPSANCIRDEDGSGNGPVNHRLEAFDYDLGNPGATYYYEAHYMVNGDQNLENNIGSRRATMSWDGNEWDFTTPPSSGNPLVEGPAIERWADADFSARGDFGADDGIAILSVNTTDLGGGQWRYEYALFNWTVDRRFRSFSVPNVGGASDFSFRDIDDQAANDWVVSTAGKNVTWTFNDVNLPGHKVGGPLEFCQIYNFGFTSNREPANRDAVMRVNDAGPGGVLLNIETLGPAVLAVSASNVAPEEGATIDLEVRGGSAGNGALIAVLDVAGIPLSPPLVLTPAAVPFVGGLASTPLTVPAGLAGLEFTLIAAEYDTSVVQLSNVTTLAVH